MCVANARFLLQALVAFLAAGFLSSGSCTYTSCSGSGCDDDRHEHHSTASEEGQIRAYRMETRGLPPGDVSRLLTRIHGPWLLAEERAEARLRSAFAGRVVAANRELFGLSPTAELEFDAHAEGDDLLLEARALDLHGPCRVTLRIEENGRLSAVRLQRPGL